jgi:23S rRNA maturation mini-RNase III
MKTKKNKTFDCIAMKREAQKAIRAKVQGMTREEEVAFFREGREEFDKRVQAAKQQRLTRHSSEVT